MRISDWSSDVCSSDLQRIEIERRRLRHITGRQPGHGAGTGCRIADPQEFGAWPAHRGVAAIVQYGTEAGLQRGPALAALADVEVGRATWRERVCPAV